MSFRYQLALMLTVMWLVLYGRKNLEWVLNYGAPEPGIKQESFKHEGLFIPSLGTGVF